MKTNEDYYIELKYWFSNPTDSDTQEIILLIIEQIRLDGQQVGSELAFKAIKDSLK